MMMSEDVGRFSEVLANRTAVEVMVAKPAGGDAVKIAAVGLALCTSGLIGRTVAEEEPSAEKDEGLGQAPPLAQHATEPLPTLRDTGSVRELPTRSRRGLLIGSQPDCGEDGPHEPPGPADGDGEAERTSHVVPARPAREPGHDGQEGGENADTGGVPVGDRTRADFAGRARARVDVSVRGVREHLRGGQERVRGRRGHATTGSRVAGSGSDEFGLRSKNSRCAASEIGYCSETDEVSPCLRLPSIMRPRLTVGIHADVGRPVRHVGAEGENRCKRPQGRAGC